MRGAWGIRGLGLDETLEAALLELACREEDFAAGGELGNVREAVEGVKAFAPGVLVDHGIEVEGEVRAGGACVAVGHVGILGEAPAEGVELGLGNAPATHAVGRESAGAVAKEEGKTPQCAVGLPRLKRWEVFCTEGRSGVDGVALITANNGLFLGGRQRGRQRRVGRAVLGAFVARACAAVKDDIDLVTLCRREGNRPEVREGRGGFVETVAARREGIPELRIVGVIGRRDAIEREVRVPTANIGVGHAGLGADELCGGMEFCLVRNVYGVETTAIPEAARIKDRTDAAHEALGAERIEELKKRLLGCPEGLG